jgi:ribosomal protein S18 acetylase RimI-like enzyme
VAEQDSKRTGDLVALRLAERDDALAIATVHVAAWQAGYAGIFDQDFLDALDPLDRVHRYDLGHDDPTRPSTTVAVLGHEIVGFATVGPSRDDDLVDAGELMALYVDPAHSGQGVGTALLDDATRRLEERGLATGSLWVLTENHRAEALYAAHGWSRDGTVRTETPWGVVATVRRLRRPLRSG